MAQPLAAVPPYGCGIPLAGVTPRCRHHRFCVRNSRRDVGIAPYAKINFGFHDKPSRIAQPLSCNTQTNDR